MKLARGDFVVVLDADDLFDEHRLEALGRLATSRPDLDILATDAVVGADGVPMRRAYHEGWVFPTVDQRTMILQRNFVFDPAAVRRSRWLEVGGFDPRITGAGDQ